MSGRIALMVRGLPSIGIDEAVERFSKYYPEVNNNKSVFHESPSFIGTSASNTIAFTDAKTGGYKGGQGLSADAIRDLRKLQKDFNAYIESNPDIYINNPTTESRAKLYRRVGFKDVDNQLQVLDSRKINPNDLPYVQAIDKATLPTPMSLALGNSSLPVFFKRGGNIVAGSRINKRSILNALMGYRDSADILDIEIAGAFDDRRLKRRMAQYDNEGQLLNRTSYNQSIYNPSLTQSQGIVDYYDDIPF